MPADSDNMTLDERIIAKALVGVHKLTKLAKLRLRDSDKAHDTLGRVKGLIRVFRDAAALDEYAKGMIAIDAISKLLEDVVEVAPKGVTMVTITEAARSKGVTRTAVDYWVKQRRVRAELRKNTASTRPPLITYVSLDDVMAMDVQPYKGRSRIRKKGTTKSRANAKTPEVISRPPLAGKPQTHRVVAHELNKGVSGYDVDVEKPQALAPTTNEQLLAAFIAKGYGPAAIAAKTRLIAGLGALSDVATIQADPAWKPSKSMMINSIQAGQAGQAFADDVANASRLLADTVKEP